MNKKNIKENASSGSTSAGSIATVSSGLNYSLLKRLPETEFFVDKDKQKFGGYIEYKQKK